MIVISYNVEQYLEDAIKSCLVQEMDFEFEILIGDDGSDDGSIDIIKEYQKKYPDIIKYYIMERNNPQNIIPSLRLSNVIKRGFSLSSGDYLMVMSGDDLLVDKHKCQKQVDFLEGNPKYSASYTNFIKFWDNGDKEEQHNYQLSSNSIFWSRYYAQISCFVFRRAVLENIANHFNDDTGLTFSILKTGKIKYIPIVSFGYRQRAVSITASSNSMDLNIVEILLMQDLLEKRGYLFSTLARFSRPLENLYKNRELLGNQRYEKYLTHSNEYKYNIVAKFKNYANLSFVNRCKLQGLIFVSMISRKFFAICSIKDRLANR